LQNSFGDVLTETPPRLNEESHGTKGRVIPAETEFVQHQSVHTLERNNPRFQPGVEAASRNGFSRNGKWS
jgi:hypothetical protein